MLILQACKVQLFNFQNGISIARPKLHVTSTLDLRLRDTEICRYSLEELLIKNDFKKRRASKYNTNDLNDFQVHCNLKNTIHSALKCIFEMENCVINTHSVLAVTCAVRFQSSSVLFPRNYLTNLEILRVLPLQEKFTTISLMEKKYLLRQQFLS